ncbi:MAG TPA: hypothetical protein VGI81_24505 [Tepidisphaeraceae bacterium]|jgi:hypothetical protein
MRTLSLGVILAIAAGSAWTSFVRAAPPSLPPEPVARLTLRPMATTQPALKYKLLPELQDQDQGNAATLYLMASKLGPDEKQAFEQIDRAIEYLARPIDQMPRDKAGEVLSFFPSRLRLADLAAHREEAKWDYSFREEGADALLPHLNDARGFALLWSLQARLQLLRDDWPAAARSILDGLSLARQLNRQAVLAQALVGSGIADEMLEQSARDWISRPDAPNLYWSLSSLPQPFVDLHEVARWERAIIYFTFPVLRDARRGTADAGRWRAFFVQLPALNRLPPRRRADTFENETEAAVLAAVAYPRARAHLLATGRTAQQVDAMSIDEAVGTYFLDDYRKRADEAWQAWELPFPEGRAAFPKWSVWAIDRRVPREPGANPLTAFASGNPGARFQFARLDREIALLRIVEAVRDYAARHDGQPPNSLDEIKDLPVPIDPVRGQPFRYERHGQDVTIEATSYSEYPRDGERYELTVVR